MQLKQNADGSLRRDACLIASGFVLCLVLVLATVRRELFQDLTEIRDDIVRSDHQETSKSSFVPPIRMLAKHKSSSKLRFLFVVGSEGAGHHFLLTMMRGQSPVNKTLSTMPGVGRELAALMVMLWNNKNGGGFFNFQCSGQKTDETNQLGSPERVVKQFVKIQNMVESHVDKQQGRGEVVLPLNIIHSIVRAGKTGMMSYPNLQGKCRALQFPDIGALYEACEMARVQCSHLLLLREPYAVIRSTVANRHFSELAKQVKLMSAMLAVIQAQMINQQKHPYWCWEYGKEEGSEQLGEALGYGDPEQFQHDFNSKFQRSTPVGPGERDGIVPPHIQTHMQSLILTTQNLGDMCARHRREQLPAALPPSSSARSRARAPAPSVKQRR